MLLSSAISIVSTDWIIGWHAASLFKVQRRVSCIIVSIHLSLRWPSRTLGEEIKLTMSTVTSPTLVAPCALRKFLTRSCSFGILSAKIALKSVLSLETLRAHVMMAGQYFCNREDERNLFLKCYLINRNYYVSRLFTLAHFGCWP